MIRKIERRGQRVLVIDIRYKKPDGSKDRYRHDAQVQTMAAATAEERRLLANIAKYGEKHTPKTSVREVPIARRLAILLANVEAGPRDGHVAVTDRGEPWGASTGSTAPSGGSGIVLASPAGLCTRSGTTPSRRGSGRASRSMSSRRWPGTGTWRRPSTTCTS